MGKSDSGYNSKQKYIIHFTPTSQGSSVSFLNIDVMDSHIVPVEDRTEDTIVRKMINLKPEFFWSILGENFDPDCFKI